MESSSLGDAEFLEFEAVARRATTNYDHPFCHGRVSHKGARVGGKSKIKIKTRTMSAWNASDLSICQEQGLGLGLDWDV